MISNGISNGNATNHARPTLDALDSPGIKRRSRHAAKLNMGDTKDDIHVCIMCLRAIMNNKVRYCVFKKKKLIKNGSLEKNSTRMC